MRNKLNKRIVGIIDKTNFWLFFFCSLTSLDKEVVTPILPKVIKRTKVGNTNIYKPIPSVPTTLVNIILITIAMILEIKPPIMRMSVDFINLFFFNEIT